jgi:recombination protein RecA
MTKKVKKAPKVITAETVLEALTQKYKEGVYMGTDLIRREKISTGSMLLDEALGGGFIRGKIIELYGPESCGKTTLAFSLLANIKGFKGFIDAESAYERETAELYNVDTSNMLVQRPGYIEQGMDMTLDMVNSGMEAVVFDSIAGSPPKAELEGNMEDHSVGKKATRMGQLMRKLHLIADENGCTCLFINQIRDSMAMFGCLHGETLILFEDGRSLPIREVVEDKIKGRVYSVDTGNYISTSEIVDWHDNGLLDEGDDWYTIKSSNGDNKNGLVAITVTSNHEILTMDGNYQVWLKANEIKPGMKSVSWTQSKLNATLLDFMSGAFAGDSPILIRSENTGAFTIRESDNPEYVQWKVNKISPFYDMKEYKEGYAYISPYDVEIADYRKRYGNRLVAGLADNLTSMGLAVWYMDDGTYSENRVRAKISVRRESVSLKDRKLMLNKLKDWGLDDCKFGPSGLSFNKYSAFRFYEIIKQYIPDCMQYKLPKEFRGYYRDFDLYSESSKRMTINEVISVTNSSKKKLRSKRKYDISVAHRNNNYIAGGKHSGIIVHNSPITTPGGHALKFHASYRLWVKSTTKIEAGGQLVGHYMKVFGKKNKYGPPSFEIMVPLIYGYGISNEWEVMDLAVKENIIEKSGSWYAYGGSKIAQGQFNTFSFLLDNPELTEEIKLKLNERKG